VRDTRAGCQAVVEEGFGSVQVRSSPVVVGNLQLRVARVLGRPAYVGFGRWCAGGNDVPVVARGCPRGSDLLAGCDQGPAVSPYGLVDVLVVRNIRLVLLLDWLCCLRLRGRLGLDGGRRRCHCGRRRCRCRGWLLGP